MFRLTKRHLFFYGFLATVFLILYVLYAQYVLGLEPCPLCILQRIAVIVLGMIFLCMALLPPRTTGIKLTALIFIIIFSLAGVGVAGRHIWLQHLPPDQIPGCGGDLAYMISNFPLFEVFGMVFSGSGECAEINWSFLSLSMPAWALICFIFFALYGTWAIYQTKYNGY